MKYYNEIKSLLFGLAIGDALGVPVEFESREYLKENPVEDMIGYGTYNKPPGTFSDDSSLTFSLVESLINGYDLNGIAQNIVKWFEEGFWTADGEVFDIGETTRVSISNLQWEMDPFLSGLHDDCSNGNGSLMRIAPLAFILMPLAIAKRFQITKEVSTITHNHVRSVIACFYFLEFLRLMLKNNLGKFEIYHKLQMDFREFLDIFFEESVHWKEMQHFNRLLKDNIFELGENEINSSGYVIHTLEASIWCLMTTDNYHDAVLKAVNLGSDTDTTASVTGALAGLLYGYGEIPKEWVETLARSSDIDDLAIRFADSLK